MKVVTIVGARPQFVKASVVSLALEGHGIQEVLVHTGQHYDDNLSAVFFREMQIRTPDYNLGVGSGLHGDQTGRMLMGIEHILVQEKPDWVVVYGDTNSTLAGALAAAKLQIAVAHIEAGLRSYDRTTPEEVNRIATDHISDLLFTPTEASKRNLLREGIDPARIKSVGDVMYDAALLYGAKADLKSRILEQLQLKPQQYLLATIHRAENTLTQGRLAAVFGGLCEVAKRLPVVVPLHPRTKLALEKSDMLGSVKERIRVIPPVGYLDMVALEKNACAIATDSGGVQKEAFFYKVPCVVLRRSTEWVELIDLGWNRLVSPDSAEAVREGVVSALDSPRPDGGVWPYGDGHASERIAACLAGFGK